MARKNLCTIYDIEINIPELYSRENDEFMEPIGLIQDRIQTFSAVVRQTLVQYFGADVEVDNYLTYPVARRKNFDRNSFLKTPLLTTDSTSKESDTYIVQFTDASTYEITNFLGVSAGSGSIGIDSTSADSVFVIRASDWAGGSYSAGDKFYFAFEAYEEILRLWVSYLVADSLLQGRYVSEAANTMIPFGETYSGKAKAIQDKILVTGEIVLEGAPAGTGQPPSSFESWLGYNIDEYGIMQDPPRV